jgi:hypothetical protein
MVRAISFWDPMCPLVADVWVNRLDPLLFGSCFESWIKDLWPDRHDLIAIDGKTSRRAHDKRKGPQGAPYPERLCDQCGQVGENPTRWFVWQAIERSKFLADLGLNDGVVRRSGLERLDDLLRIIRNEVMGLPL